MANNKVYNNYLMHGRTKGSRNGISTTKGYRAVGHKARGRLGPDGRYIYDMSTHKKYVADGLGSAGMGSYRSYELNTKNAKKNGIDVNFARKTVNSLNKGADNPWQQKANAAQYKDLYKDAVRSDTSRNTWQQNARASEFRTRNVDVYDPTTDTYQSMDRNKVKEFNKALVRKLEGTVTKANTPGINTATENSKKSAEQGAKNDWQQRGNEHRAANELVRDYYNKKIGDYTAEGFSKNKNGEYNVYNDTNNRWEKIYERRENAEKAAKEASQKGKSNNWQEVGTKTAALHNVGKKLADGTTNGARFGSSTGVSDKDIENLNNVITREHTKRQVAKGAKNNWQQQANAAASKKQSSKSSIPSKFDDDTSYTYTKSSKRIITPLVEQSRKYAKEHNVKPENPGSIDTDGLGETFHKIQKKQWEKDHGDALTPQERKQRGGGFLTKAINDAQKKGIKVTESSPWSAKPSTDAATFSKVMGVGNFLKNHAAPKAERSTRIRKLKNIYEGKPATPENTNPGNRPRARQKTVGSGGTGVKVRHQQGVNTAMYNDPRYTKTDVKPNAMQNDPRYTKTVAQKRLEQIASKNNTGKNSDWQRQAQVAQVNKEAKTRQQNAQKKTNAMKNDPRYTKTDIKKKTVKNDAQQAARAQAKAKAKADWKERRKKLKYK